MQVLLDFLKLAGSDARISAVHISLYVSLWKLWNDRNTESPLYVFSYEVMAVCKISSSSTYHKTIRQLHQYGFIRYVPSRSHYSGSLVEFPRLSGLS